MASATTGKRGGLVGGALTDEALDSSRSVLSNPRGQGFRGLQQHFSPPLAAELIAAVNGRSLSTLDPTAGSGALLEPVDRAARFGIEIDPDQIAAGDYTAVQGDVQQVYPLLRVLGARAARIAANPPFGLDWHGPQGRENSTVATWRMCQGLMAPRGCGAMIAGRDRFAREIAGRADAAGVYAVIECNDLFDGVELPCVLVFFVGAENRRPDAQRLELQARCDELPALAEKLREARERFASHVSEIDSARGMLVSHFEAVGKEMDRRRFDAAAARIAAGR